MKTITTLILILSTYIWAQQDSIYTLDSVVISSSRGNETLLNLPYSVINIDKNNIQRGQTGISLEELPGIAGLEINNRNNFSLGDKIILRGVGVRSSFGVRGVKIIYDGIPLTLPDGQSQLNNIDLSSAGRIEILKGSASSLYGNSAGGIINIESENASRKTLTLLPEFISGSFGLQKYIAKASGTLGTTSYLVSFNKFNYKGYRNHSSVNSSSINTVIRSLLSGNLLLKAIINYFDAPYLLNPSSLSRADAEMNPSGTRTIVTQQGAGEKTSQVHGGVTLNYFEDDFSIESTIYYLRREVKNPIPGRIIDLNRSAGGFRNSAEYNVNWSNTDLNFKVGLDLEFQKDKRNENENLGLKDTDTKPENIFSSIVYGSPLLNQEENVFNAAPFISSEISFGRLRLSAGLRYDYYRFKVSDKYFEDLSDDSGIRTMKNLSHMAGVVYRPNELMKIYFNYSTSFLTPTTSELSNNPDGRGGFNSTLMPEKTMSFETGIQGTLNRLSFSAALYLMNFADMLIPYQSSNSEEIFFRNAGKARNIGAEVSADYFISDMLSVSLSYTNLNFTFTDYLVQTGESGLVQLYGNQIPGVPQHNAGLSALFTFQGFYSKIILNGNDSYFANDFNGPAADSNDEVNNYINPSVIEMNIRAGYNFVISDFNFELFSGINNLLNRKYFSSIVPNAAGNRFFEPAPIRNWFAGIKGVF